MATEKGLPTMALQHLANIKFSYDHGSAHVING